MTELHYSLNDRRVIAADVRLPYSGVWTADLELDEAGAQLTGAAVVQLGGLTLRGTVDPTHSGEFADARRVRVLGGAGGWGKALPPRGYHNDAGVRRSTVLQDAARAAGETLVLAEGVEARFGADYARPAGPASQVFAHVAPAAVWWVDAAGVTQIAAARPSAELAAGVDLELLDFDKGMQVATLAGEPSAVGIGTVLRFPGRLAAPLVVRELVITLDEHALRIAAHGAGDRLVTAVRALVRQVAGEQLLGMYRYRAVATSVDRVQLQAVTKGRWPDLLPASLGCGIAGGWADLAPGAVVLVAFEDGAPTAPVIVSYTPRGRPGHVPVIAALDGDEVQLGGGGAGVHRIGDLGDGGTFTAGVAPVTLLYTAPNGASWSITLAAGMVPVTAAITPITGAPGALVNKAVGGSSKVKAGG